MSGCLDDLPDVDIDNNGRFKYILIKATLLGESKFLVRGYKWADYHADIYDEVKNKEGKSNFKFNCVGGGRIEHDPNGKHICIFGYSQGFGRADHATTAKLVEKKYPDYKVEWNNDGY